MGRRITLFLIVFSGINLIFIPLLSLYGLRVCPVLSIPGFGFGCYYSGAYILFTNLLNTALIFVLNSKGRHLENMRFWLQKNRIAAHAGVYLLASGMALLFLQILLHIYNLSSHSRAPEILLLASLLLGITQAYGLNWALYNSQRVDVIEKEGSFQRFWASHVLRTLLPFAVVTAVLLHFLISQSIGFNEGKTAPLVSHDEILNQTSYIVFFLFAWLLVTFTFHFLSERDHVNSVKLHLERLRDLDFKFRSDPSEAWGLWSAFIGQLNSFSKILGERMHLLKTFSRFVTAGVAEQALHHELIETTGITRELTVLMSDIRDFTAISENLTPKQVVTLLNEYFTAMLDVIASYQVCVDKFIGDGILAYVESESGLDSKYENQLGVEAAFAMIGRLDQLNKKLATMELPEIKIGIGIYRGPLIIGLIGSEAKLQHTIIGDTVNKTARLEGLCKELSVPIVISGQVWHSLELNEKTFFKSFGKQFVKGIAQPMEVFGGPFFVSSNTKS